MKLFKTLNLILNKTPKPPKGFDPSILMLAESNYKHTSDSFEMLNQIEKWVYYDTKLKKQIDAHFQHPDSAASIFNVGVEYVRCRYGYDYSVPFPSLFLRYLIGYHGYNYSLPYYPELYSAVYMWDSNRTVYELSEDIATTDSAPYSAMNRLPHFSNFIFAPHLSEKIDLSYQSKGFFVYRDYGYNRETYHFLVMGGDRTCDFPLTSISIPFHKNDCAIEDVVTDCLKNDMIIVSNELDNSKPDELHAWLANALSYLFAYTKKVADNTHQINRGGIEKFCEMRKSPPTVDTKVIL